MEMDSLYSGATTYSGDDPYSFGEEARKAYDVAGTNHFIVPDGARPSRKKGSDGKALGYYWNEYCTIASLDFKAPIPGNFKPEAPGDATAILTIGLAVSPTSQQDGAPSPNGGRKVSAFARYNFTAYRREATNGGDFSKGHAAMTQMSNALMKSLLRALDFDTDLGLRPKEIGEAYRQNFIGQGVWATIHQGRKSEEDPERLEVVGFVVEPK